MASKNDIAWERYIEAKNIKFDQSQYLIEANELEQIANRQPRLLAKFDTPYQLPKPFREAGYMLLPVKNGQYLLLPGNLFVEFPSCEDEAGYESPRSFPLLTAGRGNSESQYIDQAYNDKLLQKFLNVEELYLTIRGREYTGNFNFQIDDTVVNVSSVQIEVDAGYEGLHDIVLIEAKIGKPDHFNFRQMYYPFRHFSALVPNKSVRNVFLTYDIPSATYFLYEYQFPDRFRPFSITLKRCNGFRISPPIKLALFDLIDVTFRSTSKVAPQANDLNKVFELLSLVEAGIEDKDDIAEYFSFAERQSRYYLEAAEYLGLLRRSGHSYELTEAGIQILSAAPVDQRILFAKAIVNSQIFARLIQKAGTAHQFSDQDIDELIAGISDPDEVPRYSGTTVPRRRMTINAWLKWLAKEIGCFALEDGYYVIK